MHIQWYATLLRGDELADAISDWAAPAALRSGATHYSVQRSQDDRYRILEQIWFEDHDAWYRYWEGTEMREFRARYSGRYQIPINYVWHEECAAGDAPVTQIASAQAEGERSASA